MGYADRVRAGIVLLDDRRPAWWQQIDATRLDMSNGCACILGQLFGHFTEGIEELCDGGDSVSSAVLMQVADQHGFDALAGYWSDRPMHDVTADYRTLERLWRFAIRKRQAVAS
jgi:hypothetical protein